MPWLKSNFRCASIPRASFRIKFSAPSWKRLREPQNPLLLLAKLRPTSHSANYDQFKQQGFEIACRLQDAKALQAFREEKHSSMLG